MNTEAYSVSQFKRFDLRAIRHYGIPGIVLMENAGLRAADLIRDEFELEGGTGIVVVCGRGNNAGDGFVVARHLVNSGYAVRVFVLADNRDIAGDAAVNLSILSKMRVGLYFRARSSPDRSFVRRIKDSALIVDAVFGIGLCRNIEEPLKSYIRCVNDSGKPVVAIDVPSGLDADTGDILGDAIIAAHTVTMTAAKRGFFIGHGPRCVGKLHVADIGLPAELFRHAKKSKKKYGRPAELS